MDIEIRVRYHETDNMGVVHHANYFPWFEMGRIELIRQQGHSYTDWEKAGIFLPVIEAKCQYLAPVRFDDQLNLQINGPVADKLRLCFNYTLTNKQSKQVVARGSTTHVVVNAQGKPVMWPAQFRQFLESVK